MSYDADWYSVVEAGHEIQNPVSANTIRGLGQMLELGPGSRVLDVACGTCGPALVLARQYGCKLTCVDKTPAFLAIARRRIATAGLERQIELVEANAASLEVVEPHFWDAALCLGASFVFGGLVKTLERLSEAAQLVAVGEPYLELTDTVERAETAGVTVKVAFLSTEQEWENYEALRMLALKRWLTTRPEHAFSYLRREREAQQRRRDEGRGWAILLCRVHDSAGIAA